MNIDIIDEYFKLHQKVNEYFNFVEDWVVYPFDDRREYYWTLLKDDEIRFSVDAEALIALNIADDSTEVSDEEYDELKGEIYSNTLYKQRFYTQWVYKGEKYTMIFVDTQTDNNKFFAIYENDKEIKKEEPLE